jgi:hypothetical protein
MKNVGSWNSLALALLNKETFAAIVTMMSWDRVWVDLRLFTTQFFDTWKLREWE